MNWKKQKIKIYQHLIIIVNLLKMLIKNCRNRDGKSNNPEIWHLWKINLNLQMIKIKDKNSFNQLPKIRMDHNRHTIRNTQKK